MPITLGSMHLSNSRTYEVQRVHNFEVVIEGLPETVTLSVISFPIPETSNGVISLKHGNADVKVAGAAEFSDGQLVVRDAIVADIERVLYEWRRQVYDPTTDRIGWAAEYKKQGYVHQYAPDGTHVRTWKIIGMWPSAMSASEMNNESSDKKNITLTIQYDRAYPI